MFELGATLCGEGGLAWSRRLLVIHHSLESGGRVGFSPPLARYLADKYGYTAEGVPAARARQVELLRGLDQQVARQRAAGSPDLVGARLTAADIYLAATLGSMAPPAQGVRPIIKALRPVFEHLDPEIAAALTPALLAHRDRIAPWLPHQ
jgi:glutathione S-transferase